MAIQADKIKFSDIFIYVLLIGGLISLYFILSSKMDDLSFRINKLHKNEDIDEGTFKTLISDVSKTKIDLKSFHDEFNNFTSQLKGGQLVLSSTADKSVQWTMSLDGQDNLLIGNPTPFALLNLGSTTITPLTEVSQETTPSEPTTQPPIIKTYITDVPILISDIAKSQAEQTSVVPDDVPSSSTIPTESYTRIRRY